MRVTSLDAPSGHNKMGRGKIHALHLSYDFTLDYKKCYCVYCYYFVF